MGIGWGYHSERDSLHTLIKYLHCGSCSPKQKVPALIRTQSGASKCLPCSLYRWTPNLDLLPRFLFRIRSCISECSVNIPRPLPISSNSSHHPSASWLSSVCNSNGIAILSPRRRTLVSPLISSCIPHSAHCQSPLVPVGSLEITHSCFLPSLRWKPRLLVCEVDLCIVTLLPMSVKLAACGWIWLALVLHLARNTPLSS